MAPLVWLITGSTSGIGTALMTECLSRGDKVIATGRKVVERLNSFKSENLALLELDVTTSVKDMQDRLKDAWAIFGQIDVLVNNAGISAFKAAEEADENLVNNMFHVNVFGPMRISQLALPLFREQGHGTLAFTSSSSLWTPLPFMSHYAASKAALSTYVEALHKEVRSFNIRCVAFECGGFPTNLGQPREPAQEGFGTTGPTIPEYSPLFAQLMEKFATNPTLHMPGDIKKAAATMVDIIKPHRLESTLPWTVRIPLGSDGWGRAKQRCEEQLKVLKRCEEVAQTTDRKSGQGLEALEQMFTYETILN
ncbi:hypothetical protein S40285_09212 [Stachybotrys chlorohalonatus IBT 40285]|uniref:Uncharacterized protein n=1 Tax=Stachybotrys chlorohalonatus (strain IBT 40285) TaxID=1283841 RepID=A0A084QZC1_STAC4|nr:hypothetical protein S40285_09212 [Stachybotrys chlorohalonata IBT 40285]